MDRDPNRPRVPEGRPTSPAAAEPGAPWTRPQLEVVCLACELSGYAPDDGGPLF